MRNLRNLRRRVYTIGSLFGDIDMVETLKMSRISNEDLKVQKRLTFIRGPFVMPKQKEVAYAEKCRLFGMRKIRRPVCHYPVQTARVRQVYAGRNDASACAENTRRIEPSMHG